MHAPSLQPPLPPIPPQVEARLLEELRCAEAEFKQAGPDQIAAAEERFRRALRRFSELVLDRRVPRD